MKEINANIFSFEVLSVADAICITTNGITKNNGDAVMGAGVAKAAVARWPKLPTILGKKLTRDKNSFGAIHRVHILEFIVMAPSGNKHAVLSFPTKEHWKNKSSVALIKTSAEQLVFLSGRYKWTKVFIPRPGCSNGGLNWEKDVKPVIEPILDDRFTICSYNPYGK